MDAQLESAIRVAVEQHLFFADYCDVYERQQLASSIMQAVLAAHSRRLRKRELCAAHKLIHQLLPKTQ